MGLSLVAFDTNHIKRYVFGTNKLKEIRGASSLLDYLNRIVMKRIAEQQNYNAHKVYANGGSGLFYLATEQADEFGRKVQQAYYDETGGGASITFVTLLLPDDVTEENIDTKDITNRLELLQWRLQEKKLRSSAFLPLISHPFLRLCDACGIEYASPKMKGIKVVHDPGEEEERYCISCQLKRARDWKIKELIPDIEGRKEIPDDEYMWTTIIQRLDEEMHYDFRSKPERPSDFNVFRNFKGAKDYIGLVYADGNNMGQTIRNCKTLAEHKTLADKIDDALYTAVCTAIARHLKVDDHLKPEEQRAGKLQHSVFPFDILLLGGDDICMVVPASVALDVALTLAETFHTEAGPQRTLSVGVVLAPIKYPFGLLQETASTALEFAKKKGAEARAGAKETEDVIDDTRINYLIVTGGSSSDFKSVHEATYHKQDEETDQEFYATLRPYASEDLRVLLKAIRGKDGANLGRTKLHQIREAVLKMNLTTSVSDGMAVLVNWREKQRNHVVSNVYEFAGRCQLPRSNPDDPVSGFPRVTFPWFYDGKKKRKNKEYDVYRTSLLDFIELYDFVSREGGDASDED